MRRGTPDLWIDECPSCGIERYFTPFTEGQTRCVSCPEESDFGCDVTGCDGSTATAVIGEGGDLFLCAKHASPAGAEGDAE